MPGFSRYSFHGRTGFLSRDNSEAVKRVVSWYISFIILVILFTYLAHEVCLFSANFRKKYLTLYVSFRWYLAGGVLLMKKSTRSALALFFLAIRAKCIESHYHKRFFALCRISGYNAQRFSLWLFLSLLDVSGKYERTLRTHLLSSISTLRLQWTLEEDRKSQCLTFIVVRLLLSVDKLLRIFYLGILFIYLFMYWNYTIKNAHLQ